jgi:peptidoglycan/LPS O-acetylase OafA/YrhL
MATPNRASNIYALTSVRFFAAMLVVFHHTVMLFLPALYKELSVNAPHSFLTGLLLKLPVSVNFFYLLSGYVMSLVYLCDGQPVDTQVFFPARFARIYPLYLLTLFLDAPFLLFEKIHRYGMAMGTVKTAAVFAAKSVLLQGWYPRWLAGIDTPNLTLTAETVFYLCFPLMGPQLWKLRGARIGTTALCLWIVGLLLVICGRHILPAISVVAPIYHLPTFAVGVLLARWHALYRTSHRTGESAGESTPIRPQTACAVLALAATAIAAVAVAAAKYSMVDVLYAGLLTPVFAGVIWSLSAVATPFSRMLCADWLIALGNASFAVYLLHTPMAHLFEYLHWNSHPAMYAVYLAALVGLSLLSFTYFETPLRLGLVQFFRTRSSKPTVWAKLTA